VVATGVSVTPQLVPLKITSHRGKGGAQDFPREAMEARHNPLLSFFFFFFSFSLNLAAQDQTMQTLVGRRVEVAAIGVQRAAGGGGWWVRV
jgi:hypothetical protein